MAINNTAVDLNSNRSFKKADAFLRPRLVIRNKEGEIVETKWVCKDVPIFNSSINPKSMIAHSAENPEYTYELQATVHVPGTVDDKEMLTFE